MKANELRASELRIGNYLLTSKPEFNGIRDYPITKISSEMIDYIDKDKLLCVPIPLTEEILLKCGFVITVDPENVHYKKVVNNDFNESFVINRKVGYEVFYIGHKDCNDYLHFTTQIKHVNQLQNIYFSITNEELKIEL